MNLFFFIFAVGVLNFGVQNSEIESQKLGISVRQFWRLNFGVRRSEFGDSSVKLLNIYYASSVNLKCHTFYMIN